MGDLETNHSWVFGESLQLWAVGQLPVHRPIVSMRGHGSKSRSPVNIPIPTKIGSKMGGVPTPE